MYIHTCVCVCVCVCVIYVYIYMYMYVYTYTYICIYIICVCVCVCVSVYVSPNPRHHLNPTFELRVSLTFVERKMNQLEEATEVVLPEVKSWNFVIFFLNDFFE